MDEIVRANAFIKRSHATQVVGVCDSSSRRLIVALYVASSSRLCDLLGYEEISLQLAFKQRCFSRLAAQGVGYDPERPEANNLLGIYEAMTGMTKEQLSAQSSICVLGRVAHKTAGRCLARRWLRRRPRGQAGAPSSRCWPMPSSPTSSRFGGQGFFFS
eukprot:4897419-Pleurochrysis_carterae.AAC.2